MPIMAPGIGASIGMTRETAGITTMSAMASIASQAIHRRWALRRVTNFSLRGHENEPAN